MPAKKSTKRVEKREGIITVARLLKVGRKVVMEDNEQASLDVREFLTDSASVSVAKGMTISMGNYQSANFRVSITMPCYAEEVPEVYEMVEQSIEEKLLAEVEAAKGYFDGLG